MDRSRHFNYYAFDGTHRSTRWRHESEDFHRDLDGLADRLTPQHNYRLTAQASNGHHYGEAACRDFRESVVVNALPHAAGSAGTPRPAGALSTPPNGEGREGFQSGDPGASRRWAAGVPRVLSTLNPRRALAGAINRAWRAPRSLRSRSAGGRGHSPDGQIGAKHRAPNVVIVAHQEGGVEVIHLYSGKTLCKMVMPPGGLHADINARVVDHVQAHGGGGVARGPSGDGRGRHPRPTAGRRPRGGTRARTSCSGGACAGEARGW